MAVKLQIPKWFIPYLYPCEYKDLHGGRGSGKSHAAATLVIARVAHLFRDPDAVKYGAPYYPYIKTRILSGREFSTTLEASVKVVLEEKIYNMGLNDQFIIKNEEIVHKELGSKIIFKGLGRNINNIRSAEGIAMFHLEEAQFLTKELMDILIPTARWEYYCTLTGIKFTNEKLTIWNPENRGDWAWQRFVVNPRPGDLSTHVNFTANPYLPEVTIREAMYNKIESPDEYNYIWGGRPNDSNTELQILPYSLIERCFDSWDARPEISSQMRADCGLDIATGGADNCCAVVRVGPIVEDMKVWNGTLNLNQTARTTVDFFDEVCERVGVEGDNIFYDAGTPMEGAFEHVDCKYIDEAVGFGTKPTGPEMLWDNQVTNDQYFARRNIQLATALRQRAIRTSKYLDGDDSVDPWSCLWINPEIGDKERVMAMLTQPVRRRNPTSDKWEVHKQGVNKDLKSPDEFDGMVLAFTNDSAYGLQAEG